MICLGNSVEMNFSFISSENNYERKTEKKTKRSETKMKYETTLDKEKESNAYNK